MKRWQGLFAGLLALGLAWMTALAPAGTALAAGEKGYTYTVTFYSGNQGTFRDGRTRLKVEGKAYGSRVNFDIGDVILPNDSKYYVKGIRKSGRDNNTVDQVSASSLLVEADADYVVAYGIKGDMVRYTVNYVDDATGNALAESRTYYGNIGDKPVVAFLYVDGYVPQAYNLTKTLVANEADNVFTFRYELIEGTTEVTPAPQTPAPTTPAAPAAGGGAAAAGGGAAAGGAAAGTGAEGGAAAGEGAEGGEGTAAAPTAEGEPLTEVPETEIPLAQQPENLVDLDEGEVPLSDGSDMLGEGTTDTAGTTTSVEADTGILGSTAFKVGIAAALLAALAVGGVLVYRRMHPPVSIPGFDDYDDDDEDEEDDIS